MVWLRRCSFVLAVLLIFSLAAWFVPGALDPTRHSPQKKVRDRLWVSSSPYFLDRQACRWISLCGLHHLRRDPAIRGAHTHPDSPDNSDDDQLPGGPDGELKRRSWEEANEAGPGRGSGSANQERADKKRNPTERRKILKDIPDYVLKHAPLVHLYSGEEFWPSDIRDHVEHMTVTVDRELVNTTEKWNLGNLQRLNEYDGWVVLHSDDNVESRPSWLHSHGNKPKPFNEDGGDVSPPPGHQTGPHEHKEPTTWYDVDKKHPLHRISDPRSRNRPSSSRPGSAKRDLVSRGHKPNADGYSKAPAILVIVDKGSGIVDAFWFFFYSYNLGQTVLGLRFGNHIGDWEHCMVRFEHGVPRGIFFSEHEGGQAYAWEAVEKRNDRPVLYSAVGSHAMYALPGKHPYVLPFGLLKDVTNRGPLWDPALNKYAYHYNYARENPRDTREFEGYKYQSKLVNDPHTLTPAASNPKAPTSWFHFRGRWGDELYSLADPRQWRIFGQYHYVTGPSGPKFKHLERAKMCQRRRCRILYEVDPKGTWY